MYIFLFSVYHSSNSVFLKIQNIKLIWKYKDHWSGALKSCHTSIFLYFYSPEPNTRHKGIDAWKEGWAERWIVM